MTSPRFKEYVDPGFAPRIKTWGEAADWTIQDRWKHQKSFCTVQRRLNRIDSSIGKSFPLRKMENIHFWKELQLDILETDGVDNATVNRAISLATCALRHTYNNQLHSVRCPSVPKLQEGPGRQKHFTKQNVADMVQCAYDLGRDDLADIIQVGAYTGIREGYLLNYLKAEDVEFNQQRIKVGFDPKRPTKTGQPREIFIHPLVKPILMERSSRDFLFKDDWSNRDQLMRAFKKVRRMVGIPEIKHEYVFHTLRHSCATWLGAIAKPNTVKSIMGHASMKTTERYCKFVSEEVENAISAL